MPAKAPRQELLAFLRAIKAEPDDNTAKLVLADWLQEQPAKADQARGEYLRELVRWHAAERDTPEWEAGIKRINRLWKKHEQTWFGDLEAAGFRADYLNCSWGVLSTSIEGTKVVTKKALALTDTEEYAWVGSIDFHRLGDVQALHFANSPLLDSLAGLSFNNCNARLSYLAQIVLSTRSAGLRELSYSKVPAPVALVAREPHLSHLRKLRTWHTPVIDYGFKSLCDSSTLNELHSLEISNASLTIHAARAFAEASGLPALTELNLGGTNRLGPDGTLILVSSPNAGRLRSLNLWSNGIADYGVEAICKQPHLKLTHLDVSGNLLTNRAAVAIAEADNLKGLEELHLETNNISGDGAIALAKSANLKHIKRLVLTGNRLGAKAAGALRERFGDAVELD